jgi:hypothetical protein
MRLYSSQQRPFADIRHVALAIAVVRDGRQHVGILHKAEVIDEVKLGHLAWHNQLKDSQPKDCYLWVDPPIPTRRARQVAARCRQILNFVIPLLSLRLSFRPTKNRSGHDYSLLTPDPNSHQARSINTLPPQCSSPLRRKDGLPRPRPRRKAGAVRGEWLRRAPENGA